MDVLAPLALIICGILAAASLIVKKQPNAQDLINKLRPYQGYIGVGVCVIGIISVVRCLLALGFFLSTLVGMIFLATAVVETLLGFLLGYGLINKYALGGSPEAAAKAVEMQRKLMAVQEPLGLVGIALGIICLILRPHWYL